MKKNKYIFGVILFMILFFVGCQNSPLLYRGNRLVDKPMQHAIDNSIIYAIDFCNGTVIDKENIALNNNDTISITGWAMSPDSKKLKKVIIHVGDRYISANYGFFRYDVQELVSSSDNEYGYEFSFSKEILYDSTGNRINKIEMMGITQKNELLNADTITISYQE
ncbi:MAG: hypothetical protein IJ916_01940 [Paludibacteraceae bacterium]|nr:hypothetical protein [Paludibacteraceae bacterium]